MRNVEFNIINNAEKMSETDTHVYFLNGPFSQWYPSDFMGNIGDTSYKFNCAEQYMMAGKAHLFGDETAFLDIMEVEQTKDWHDAPNACKTIGRRVKNFDVDIWNQHALQIVFQGNLYKFLQNEPLANRLRETKDKILVEGARYDTVWGVGLAWNDPAILDDKNWKGTNWLGETLMQVRTNL